MGLSTGPQCLCRPGWNGTYCQTPQAYPCSNYGTPRSNLLSIGLIASYYSNFLYPYAYEEMNPNTEPSNIVEYQAIQYYESFVSNWTMAIWSGYLTPSISGNYTMQFTAQDGIKMHFGGKLVINAFLKEGPTAYSFNVALIAGYKYPLLMYYFNAYSGSEAVFSWKPPGQSEFTAVPISALTFENPCICNNSTYGPYCQYGTLNPCQATVGFNAYWPEAASGATINGTCEVGYTGLISRTCLPNSTFGPVTGSCQPNSTAANCQNGGTPVIGSSDMICLCPNGFNGFLCQNQNSESTVVCSHFGVTPSQAYSPDRKSVV